MTDHGWAEPERERRSWDCSRPRGNIVVVVTCAFSRAKGACTYDVRKFGYIWTPSPLSPFGIYLQSPKIWLVRGLVKFVPARLNNSRNKFH